MHRLSISSGRGAAGTIVLLLLIGVTVGGCEDFFDDSDENGPDGPGIAEGIFGKMGEPMERASQEERELFDKGRDVALHRFSADEGLGPSFNVSRCVSCHEQPAFGGSSPRYRNFYLVGERKEGEFELHSSPESRENSDGDTIEAPTPATTKGGVQLRYGREKPHRNQTPEDVNVVATRNAIPFFGIGALAIVDDSDVRDLADPDDENNDGISGEMNQGSGGAVGRFGLKAQTRSLEGFVRGPMFNHAGITSDPLRPERRGELPMTRPFDENGDSDQQSDALRARKQRQVALPDESFDDSDGVPDPEMSRDELFQLVSFVRLLAAPEPDELDAEGRRGEKLFGSIGCTDCHTPTLSSPIGKIPAYTDLLIHDMGKELADGIEQSSAAGSEFRTQPLWGIAATEPYLHDGRADTIDEAIRMHGGEAERASRNYVRLSNSDREAVVAFLRSLGGADRDSEGRIAPDAPTPKPGELEGPVEGLTDQESAEFARGRRLFDRDMKVEDGLGPRFNGDSCRACHFEPTPGGGGPPGVNVTREGHLSSNGTFTAPPGGTLLHRFVTSFDTRPSPHASSNVFELRQPPALYGLGKLDDVPAEHIRRRADPADMDGDGISGRVAELANGTVGRFGWKGVFSTLEDFVRDALTNEMGMTVPERSGVHAGRRSDSDWVDDPEFDGPRYDALVLYVDSLAPPPRPENPEGDVSTGKQVFESVGCADCHTPTLETDDGEKVRAYTDLLLHRVMPRGYEGVADGASGPREFRTPPLWGISESGPYMHDGLSGSLDAAIRRHAGEASSASNDYEQLSEGRRKALIAFLESL